MAEFDYDIVGKIGSMALIRKEDSDIDYNIFSRVCSELKPGMIWVSSGATEIGRLDYIKRNGSGLDEVEGKEEAKTDYSAQGQAILMEYYRKFINQKYSVRQILVEHQHFNNPEKREYIKQTLLRAKDQGAIPIVNYNDPVSSEENRRWEISSLKGDKQAAEHVVECIDNDETASVITQLVRARTLVILTTVEGIYDDPKDPQTLVREILAKTPEELQEKIHNQQKSCVGASRQGANGAWAKLEYITKPAMQGTTVIIGSAKYRLSDLIADRVPNTRIGLI